jgi:flagellin-specific chaperone FliS
MSASISARYREAMFDGPGSTDWIRQGWRGLRQYGKRAALAIEDGDVVLKAQMIARANALLDVMTGILDTDGDAPLGGQLMDIYTSLRMSLLRANISDDLAALRDFDTALSELDRDMLKIAESFRTK